METSTTTPTPATPLAPSTCVSYDEFTINKLNCSPPEQKQIPAPPVKDGEKAPPAQHYHQIPLLYDMSNTEVKSLNDLLLEGPELTTRYGIKSEIGLSGKMEHKIMAVFNIADQAHVTFLEKLDIIHSGCAYILGQVKGAVKLPHFNPQMAEATGLKKLVCIQRDDASGEPIPGRAPAIFLKLFSRGKPPMVEQTLFTDLAGKAIPWTLLVGVEMTFIPLFHFKKIYIGGGKPSIQWEIVSAIVTNIKGRNTSTRQTDTLNRLRTARPELADAVSAQLAKLTTDRQEQMLGNNIYTPSPSPQDESSESPDQPTFAGITPTGNRAQAAPVYGASVPAMGALPTIPSLGGQPTMGDFTAQAPVRVPAISIPGMNIPGVGADPNAPIQLN